MTNNVISLSGGKDSTAMLLLMLERKEPIHSVVFFDTGWEFPQMLDHIDLLERTTGIKIIRLKSKHGFDYWMYERPVVARKGPMKGKVHRIGNGWPSPMRRWCTRQKMDGINRYLKSIDGAVSCIGFALGEEHRIGTVSQKKSKIKKRYPLVEYEVNEEYALKICKRHGYHWNSLYDIFRRVSCFCCPLQPLKELRELRKHYPDLWDRMLEMDSCIPDYNRGFHHYDTVHDLDRRFESEDKQKEIALKGNNHE